MSASSSTSATERARPAEGQALSNQDGLTSGQWAAVLVLLTLFSYGPAFYAGFIWDDPDYVLNNYNLRTTKGLIKIWLEPES
ncbi:MAG TPA: O-GlcNAc transferase, partial [Pirellulaceae bacterium]|nr:O-GlcNAc transferase [Pirellulaceae bacterium]